MNWWMVNTGELEAVGLGDDNFNFQVSRTGKLVEVTVTEAKGGKAVWHGVWNRKERFFEIEVKDV